MPGSRGRSALEITVMAAALLLAGFLAREFWKRRPAASAVERGAPSTAESPAPEAASSGRRTERATTSVPSLKLTRVRRRKAPAVPAP